ncbi:GGDEF domain-containing protein [Spiribacter insolitus]|uniref:diguanylate cyclase n=1 Tax=Spiribacter insolitus TaxID=3122417 RepID=A0ABV3T672_9GAMM
MGIVNELLDARPRELDEAIHRALERLGRFTESDRTYVFRIRDDVALDNTHEWCVDGVEPMIGMLQDLPVDIADVWWETFARGDVIEIADVDALSDARLEKGTLQAQGIKSLLAVPLVIHGEVAGFMGYDSVHSYRRFLAGEIDLIRNVAKVVAFTLDKRDLDKRARRAFLDPVTRMPNRHSLDRAMTGRPANAKTHGSHDALIFIDLDDFKQINDLHGHAVGDIVLRTLGQRIDRLQRADDAGYRYGGDEFVAIISDLDRDSEKARQEAMAVAQRLVESINKPINIPMDSGAEQLTLTVHASAGVVVADGPAADWETLLERADQAMYQAKAAGEPVGLD